MSENKSRLIVALAVPSRDEALDLALAHDGPTLVEIITDADLI